jgi:mono/diheme cytochrome c family protein
MKKTIFILGAVLLGFYLIMQLLISTMVRSTNSPSESMSQAAPDISVPRVPIGVLASAKSLKNPIPPTSENLAVGREIFRGRGACHTCHGPDGKGDGPSGVGLNPPPRDFTDSRFFELRSDGELYWVITHGSPGSSMFAYAPQIISELDAWYVVNYVQTLSDPARQSQETGLPSERTEPQQTRS